jgi:hypothetical protein
MPDYFFTKLGNIKIAAIAVAFLLRIAATEEVV